MTPTQSFEEKRAWIEQALVNLREGHGSIGESNELRDLLKRDREARLIYLEANQLSSMLESTPSTGLGTLPQASISRFPTLRRSHLISALVGAGIAALVTLLATLGPFANRRDLAAQPNPHPAQAPLASFLSGLNAVIGGKAAHGNDAFEEGQLSLDRGIAQLAFRNGAQIVLEGKCAFEIVDENTVILSHGKMWAYCPLEARGFQVLTPDGHKIIDLGTEFGVEVGPNGETDVHVFDGLVDVVNLQDQTQQIVAGRALSWAGTASGPKLGEADPAKFVTANSLTQKRMQAHHARMLARTDLLLYYDFADLSGGRVRNLAPHAPKDTDGRIIRASIVSGRNPDTNALQFEHDGDAIALELDRPERVTSFTTALWIKVDRLETALATLLNSDGWDLGDIHFQVTRSGNLRAGINGGIAYESSSGQLQPGTWQLLTVSWDLESRTARLSCDGRPLPVSENASSRPRLTLNPQFGSCQIGSWDPPSDERPGEARDFKGRIDEVMVFDHALTDQEIADLYEAGRP